MEAEIVRLVPNEHWLFTRQDWEEDKRISEKTDQNYWQWVKRCISISCEEVS